MTPDQAVIARKVLENARGQAHAVLVGAEENVKRARAELDNASQAVARETARVQGLDAAVELGPVEAGDSTVLTGAIAANDR